MLCFRHGHLLFDDLPRDLPFRCTPPPPFSAVQLRPWRMRPTGYRHPRKVAKPTSLRPRVWQRDFRWNARYIRDSMELFGPCAQLTIAKINPAKRALLAGGPNSSPKHGSERREPPRRIASSTDTAAFSALSGHQGACCSDPSHHLQRFIAERTTYLAFRKNALHSHRQSPLFSLWVALRHKVFNDCPLLPNANTNVSLICSQDQVAEGNLACCCLCAHSITGL